MSFISKVFGSGKKGECAQSPNEAVQRLREVEEMLQKKSDFLEQKIEQEVSVAKKNSSKNKQGTYYVMILKSGRGAENDGRENDGREIDGPMCRA